MSFLECLRRTDLCANAGGDSVDFYPTFTQLADATLPSPAMLKAIHAQEDREAAEKKAVDVDYKATRVEASQSGELR